MVETELSNKLHHGQRCYMWACLFLLSEGAAEAATVLQGYLESADCNRNFRSPVLQSHLKKVFLLMLQLYQDLL